MPMRHVFPDARLFDTVEPTMIRALEHCGTIMQTLEELEKRKKELELRSEIARLEREQEGRKFNRRHLYWLVPVTAIGFSVLVIGGGNDNPTVPLITSFLLLLPALIIAIRWAVRR